MFAHIRETDQIEAFLDGIKGRKTSLLIRRPSITEAYNNDADDKVEDYDYDFIYENSKPLEELEKDFMEFFEKEILSK